jgi:hypothetical protein
VTIENLSKTLAMNGYAINEISQSQIHQDIQSILDSLDTHQPRSKIHYLQDVFNEHFIYRIRMEGEEETFWRQKYSVNDETGEIEFLDDPVQVRKQVDYIDINNSTNNSSKGDNAMSDKKDDQGCCPERVKALIENTKTKFTAEDEGWLSKLNEKELERVEPDLEDEKEEPAVETAPPVETAPAETPTEETPQTLDEYLDGAPDDYKEMVQEGVELQKNKKAALVKQLGACERNPIPEADLQKKSVKELEDLAKLAALPSYIGNAPPADDETTTDNEEKEPPPMKQMEWKK